MNSRQRFNQCLGFKPVDRVPYFEEGIRQNVIRKWRTEGLPPGKNPDDIFPIDRREEIETILEPLPHFSKWPSEKNELSKLKRRLNPANRLRIPFLWNVKLPKWKNREHVLMLRVHRGLFLSMGVYEDERFRKVMELTTENPNFVREYMTIYGEFCAKMLSRILKKVELDAVIFSEPIGGNEGPLLSPQMYEDLVLNSYRPVLQLCQEKNISNVIFRTYANIRIYIPALLKFGINCLWAHEVNVQEMNYVNLRREFGRELKLIGGIDLDALRKGKREIQTEIESKVPFLVESGGYIPVADGRIREEISFENYSYYRHILEKIIQN